jgi:hypothetical protein
MHWRRLLAILPVVVFLSACLETDLTLKPDGSVAGKISWMSASKLPEAGARALLTAENVTIKQLEVKDVDIPPAKPGGTPTKGQRVTADVEAKSAEALTKTPLMQSLGVSLATATPEPSKHSLTIKAAKNERVGKILDTESTIRLHLPGPVEKTSATSKGDEVTWKVPAADFRSKPVELTVTYADAPAAAADKAKKH